MRNQFDWAGKPSTNSAEVMQQYDEKAATYDHTVLNEWGCPAPACAAQLLARHIDSQSAVLASASLPYLPGHPDFSTRIEAPLFILTVQ